MSILSDGVAKHLLSIHSTIASKSPPPIIFLSPLMLRPLINPTSQDSKLPLTTAFFFLSDYRRSGIRARGSTKQNHEDDQHLHVSSYIALTRLWHEPQPHRPTVEPFYDPDDKRQREFLLRGCIMDHSARCKAMAAFCRQRARMDNEPELFWLGEAELWTRRLN